MSHCRLLSLMRSRLHPLVSGFAELGVLSVMVRPSVPHACKHCPSVRLLRRLQFCKSGLIRLRSLDRLSLAKRGKCAAGIFTQGSKRPSWPLLGHRSLQNYRHAGLRTCTTADSASASRGEPQLLSSRMSTSVRSWVRGFQHQSDVRQVRPQLLSSRMSHQPVLGLEDFNIGPMLDKYGTSSG